MTGYLSGQEGGAQASASPEPISETESQPQENKPLTIADVERIAEEKATRIAQSFVDKAENRISAKAQEQINALRLTQTALGLSDEQVEQAANKIVLNDLKAPRAEQASPAAAAQTNHAAREVDPVIQETLDVFKAEGVTIETADPEYKPLDLILRDPNGNIHQYRKELFRQIEAKRLRVTASAQTASARVLGGGTLTTNPNDISAVTDSKQLYRMGEERLSGGRK